MEQSKMEGFYQQQNEGEELPVVLEEDSSTIVKIVDGTCGNCGYDRLKVTSHRMAGIHVEVCQACGYKREDGQSDFHRPTSEFDRLKDLREYADVDGPVEKLGEIGGSRFRHGTEVFEYTDSGVIKIAEHPTDTSTQITSISRDTVRGVLELLESSDDFVTEWIENEMNKLDRMELIGTLLPNGLNITQDE